MGKNLQCKITPVPCRFFCPGQYEQLTDKGKSCLQCHDGYDMEVFMYCKIGKNYFLKAGVLNIAPADELDEFSSGGNNSLTFQVLVVTVDIYCTAN